jgi:hypothetical protein
MRTYTHTDLFARLDTLGEVILIPNDNVCIFGDAVSALAAEGQHGERAQEHRNWRIADAEAPSIGGGRSGDSGSTLISQKYPLRRVEESLYDDLVCVRMNANSSQAKEDWLQAFNQAGVVVMTGTDQADGANEFLWDLGMCCN